jgi:hypothetical protein
MENQENNWVDGFIQSLQTAVSTNTPIKIGNADVYVTQQLVDYLNINRIRLIQVDVETFKEFLRLNSIGDNFSALTVVYDKLSTQTLIDKYKENTIKLSDLATVIQTSRDFWLALGKKIGEKLLFSALGAIL